MFLLAIFLFFLWLLWLTSISKFTLAQQKQFQALGRLALCGAKVQYTGLGILVYFVSSSTAQRHTTKHRRIILIEFKCFIIRLGIAAIRINLITSSVDHSRHAFHKLYIRVIRKVQTIQMRIFLYSPPTYEELSTFCTL